MEGKLDARRFSIQTSLSNHSFISNQYPLVLATAAGDQPLVLDAARIGIGTANPSHKLDVIGTIRAREIKVDMNGADFVFEKGYKLMPLNDLEKFVKERKHLPEISPAGEMQENGSDLGNLNSKLLQKIEELTLYIIEQDKRIVALEKKCSGI